MKFKEFRTYRTYYCALCKQIAQYSQFNRLLLSYDLVFLTILASCDTSSVFGCKALKKKSCHGSSICFGKCNGDEKLKLLAAFSVILQYHKVKDDVVDGDVKKKLLYPFLKKGFSKAKNKYPIISNIVEFQMQSLLELEKENSTDLAKLEKCFADMFIKVLKLLPDTDEDQKAVLGKIAYHIAAWVYFIDMYDDREKDKKTGNFNPLLNTAVFGKDEQIKNRLCDILITHIEMAKKLSSVLPYTDSTPIIENVLYYGMPEQMRKIGLLD